jgi:CO/xanthine dehydrogenase FAD-binding subunit
VKPSRFEYARAGSLEEALELLADDEREVRVLAGGQSLVPLMNFRLARPEVLVDINHLSPLDFMEENSSGVRIGALTRQVTIEGSHGDRAEHSLLRRATNHIGHFQIRNRGTVGGSLAHADPAAEQPTVAVALGAEITVRALGGTRVVAAEQFFVGPFMTALSSDEMITEISFPAWANAGSFKEVARRSGDFAIASAAVAVAKDPDGRIRRAGVALGGVGPTPMRMREAESVLEGRGASEDSLRDAARAAAGAAEPMTDVHGTADYRRALAEVLTFEALIEATGVQVRSNGSRRIL